MLPAVAAGAGIKELAVWRRGSVSGSRLAEGGASRSFIYDPNSYDAAESPGRVRQLASYIKSSPASGNYGAMLLRGSRWLVRVASELKEKMECMHVISANHLSKGLYKDEPIFRQDAR